MRCIMNAVEFRAKVKNGMIEIPQEYKEHFKSLVRVILLADDSQASGVNLIDQLLANPLRVKGFQPLKREAVYVR
ncbi:MAG: hypothetical protein HYZ49_21515 [Chloroflexi bacterium]|nr:hypothetical protein [Chloroflexota bacterium]